VTERFEAWFEDMRRRAWKNLRAGYENEPMAESYLLLLKPYLREPFDEIERLTRSREDHIHDWTLWTDWQGGLRSRFCRTCGTIEDQQG
jgi:hypothetical protein